MASTGGPRRKSNTAVIVVSAIVGVIVVTAIAIGIGLSAGSSDDEGGDLSPTSAYSDSTSASPTESVRPEDKTATILASECTNPTKSFSEKGKVLMPSFRFKNLESVKKCIAAAGWKYKIVGQEDSAIWGKNTVTSQTPAGVSWWYPSKDTTIELTISTGRSG